MEHFYLATFLATCVIVEPLMLLALANMYTAKPISSESKPIPYGTSSRINVKKREFGSLLKQAPRGVGNPNDFKA